MPRSSHGPSISVGVPSGVRTRSMACEATSRSVRQTIATARPGGRERLSCAAACGRVFGRTQIIGVIWRTSSGTPAHDAAQIGPRNAGRSHSVEASSAGCSTRGCGSPPGRGTVRTLAPGMEMQLVGSNAMTTSGRRARIIMRTGSTTARSESRKGKPNRAWRGGSPVAAEFGFLEEKLL